MNLKVTPFFIYLLVIPEFDIYGNIFISEFTQDYFLDATQVNYINCLIHDTLSSAI